MKKIISILFLISSFSVFAIDPHEGGGGNVCVLDSSGSPYSPIWGLLVSMDEIYFPSMLDGSEDRRRFYAPINGNSSRTVSDGEMVIANLMKTKAGLAVKDLILRLGKTDVDFAYEILNLSYFLTDVFYVDYEFKNPYGIYTDIDKVCGRDSIKAAMITETTGQTVVSQGTWNQLGFFSQKVLIVHEILRIAQLNRPWLIGYSDLDIYRLTMTIVTEKFEDLKSDQALSDFKKFKSWVPDEDVPKRVALVERKIQEFLKNGDALLAFQMTLANADLKTKILEAQKKDARFVLALDVLALKKNPAYNKALPGSKYWVNQ
jgi:hypothetical protein